MSFLSKIQNSSRSAKVRFIVMVIVIVAILLTVLWIFTSRIGKTGPKETGIFQTLGRGVKDVQDNYKK